MSSSSRWPFILMSFGVGVGDGLGIAAADAVGVAVGDGVDMSAGEASGCCAATRVPRNTRHKNTRMNRVVLVISRKFRLDKLNRFKNYLKRGPGLPLEDARSRKRAFIVVREGKSMKF